MTRRSNDLAREEGMEEVDRVQRNSVLVAIAATVAGAAIISLFGWVLSNSRLDANQGARITTLEREQITLRTKVDTMSHRQTQISDRQLYDHEILRNVASAVGAKIPHEPYPNGSGDGGKTSDVAGRR